MASNVLFMKVIVPQFFGKTQNFKRYADLKKKETPVFQTENRSLTF